jgi:hypothetical protein
MRVGWRPNVAARARGGGWGGGGRGRGTWRQRTDSNDHKENAELLPDLE